MEVSSMIKIRLMGMPVEVEALVAHLCEDLNVLSVSTPYPCRGSKFVRVDRKSVV